ncbi:MAG TPA: TIGR01244 family sulfur transferase [Pseudomonadales bacterium]|nr:TIGR01244 family sulfur transferase [Pseudomonadales bacterium]
MDIKRITPALSVSAQLQLQDFGVAASQGFKSVIYLRPDGESNDQPAREALQAAAEANGLAWAWISVVSGQVTDDNVAAFAQHLQSMPEPVLSFCRTGARAATLWALSQAGAMPGENILEVTSAAGYDLSALKDRLACEPCAKQEAVPRVAGRSHDVIVVGGGAGGLACASSLLKRQPDLDIAVVEPRSEHYYQPGWTLVGGGVFKREKTVRPMVDYIPREAKWYQTTVATFQPDQQTVTLEDGEVIGYRVLVVAPGLQLDWDAVKGLKDTLGSHGVTSNYHVDMAPYTWELVQGLRRGKAVFTQPPMPIKCAGAPQKAMYLSCDEWQRQGRLDGIDVDFCTATPGLFGVAEYVPALMEYVKKYRIQLNFKTNLVEVDGVNKVAYFKQTDAEGVVTDIEKPFDMLHVCPPQKSPDFIASSPLADAAGWVDVSPETMQHVTFGNIFAVGDAGNMPNAKTAAAVRKQAPVVAENVIMVLNGQSPRAVYDGYGSCPLTVERGKIVLAEFGYGGKLLPSFPAWLLDGRKPTRAAWLLKEKMMPWLYYDAMMRGVEWLAAPKILPLQPVAHEVGEALDCKRDQK